MTETTWSATYVADVLRVFQAADVYDELMWRVSADDTIKFSVICSDTFWWATADLEDITPDDVGLLRECLSDLNAHTDEDYLVGTLFAARKRGMRPMRLWLKTLETPNTPASRRTLGLFLAAGPERDPNEEG